MNDTPITKSDFIKFNVSSEFKALAEEKAKAHGMTVSELGRMLFGAFITGIAKPSYDISPTFLKLADKARENYKAGRGTLVSTKEELESYLESI